MCGQKKLKSMPMKECYDNRGACKTFGCESRGFRVRGSGGAFGLNPGFLNPDPQYVQGFCKSLNSPELTPAHREFLRVLRAAADGHAPDESPADWAAVLDLASLHQVAGFLYPIVCMWAPSCQPDAPLMARWRTSFLSAAAQYTRVALQARELLTALHTAGVRVIPLKGVWLAERVYADGACRPMCDIDLLVTAGELALARTTVERLGYATTDHYTIEGRDKHLHYQRPGGPLPLELHWNVWHVGVEAVDEPDLAQVWTDLHEELLHGVPVLVFPPERQLVHIAQHILHHVLTVPLRAYLDLILLCRRYAPDFNLTRLDDEARAWRVAFGAKFVLQVAVDIWGGTLPASLTSFTPSGGECERERSAALCAALQLNCESKQITPAFEAFCHASAFRRVWIGLACVCFPPSEIRLRYPLVVRRWGLVGGYLWRCADLIRRQGRAVRKAVGDGNSVDADLGNFATRRALSAWIRTRRGRSRDG